MTSVELQSLITQHSKPELAQRVGHVYQVWQDGEVTLQKSGDLLWRRNLHMIWPGFSGFDSGCDWPHSFGPSKYIFTDETGAKEIHRAIAAMVGHFPYCSAEES